MSLVSDSETSILSSANLPSANWPDFYQVGLWNYCQGSIVNNVYTVDNCTKTTGLFAFDFATIVKSASSADLTGIVDEFSANVVKSYKALSYAMTILFCLAAVFAVMEFVTGFFAFHSRGGSFCALIIAGLSLVCSLASIAIATAIYKLWVKAFFEASTSLEISASLGKTTYALGWAAAVAALLSAIFWFFSICVGSTRHARTEKDIIYTPVENPSSVRY